MPNATMLSINPSEWQMGDNVVYNETAKRTFHVIVNAKNATRKNLVMVGHRCAENCLSATTD